MSYRGLRAGQPGRRQGRQPGLGLGEVPCTKTRLGRREPLKDELKQEVGGQDMMLTRGREVPAVEQHVQRS